MNKMILTVFGASVGITCLISMLFGFAGSAIIGTFWSWFCVSLLVQVIVFALINSYFIQKEENQQQNFEVQALEKLSKFTVKLNCSYCEQPNLSPIQLNSRNTFKCESCNQINGISMQFMATTLTTPVESVKLPIENSNSIEFRVSA